MTWSTDISKAPRGKHINRVKKDKDGKESKYQEFVPDILWVHTKCGQVLWTRWIPDYMVGTAYPRKIKGWWCFLGREEQPIAWWSKLIEDKPYTKDKPPPYESA